MFLLTVAGLVFWWTVKSGQYDDLESPAHRILFDDDDHLIPGKQEQSKPSDD
jgi:cbb3-type cytochrome oxidase maturation protein